MTYQFRPGVEEEFRMIDLNAIVGAADPAEPHGVADCLALIFTGGPYTMAFKVDSREEADELLEAITKTADRIWPRRNP